MAYLEIVCLANSRKRGGRCVAGLRTDGRGWVRPVAPYEDGALYGQHYTLEDRTAAQVLDVLLVDVGEPCPLVYQPENYLVGAQPWRLLARPAGPEVAPVLRKHVELGPTLLGSASDRVSADAFRGGPSGPSLALVAPRRVDWEIGKSHSGRRQVRARFELRGAPYDLVVTDPELEQRLSHCPEGSYCIPSAVDASVPERFLLTISLSEDFNGYHYKLVAGVVAVPGAWRR